jgi:hypothetical protein
MWLAVLGPGTRYRPFNRIRDVRGRESCGWKATALATVS